MSRLNATQANRNISVKTILDDDVLLFHRMTANENLGGLFSFDLDLLSANPEINFQEMLGQSMTVQYQRLDKEIRYFNGIVSCFTQAGSHGDLSLYRATLRPWFWFLTRNADSRIFQNKTVPDIIKEVFREHGFSDFEESLTGSHREWEYCVQYRESDFSFISRLLEQEGIYYYFKHEDGKHTLVLADSVNAHETVPGYEEVPYYPPEENERRERDHLYSWTLSQHIQPGAYVLNGFDFKKPKANLLVNATLPREHEKANYEIYDYPGAYIESTDGENYARNRIEELQAQHEEAQGKGNAGGLAVGSLFTLTNHFPREDQNRQYLISTAYYQLGPQEYESKFQNGNEATFTTSIGVIDAEQPFRTPRNTKKPIVRGIQTAIVVGPQGEEIHTDEYGRVKVQFHWDRYGDANENSSCWIRVAHIWAGNNWGGVHLPRIGQEVIVDFLEGNPDRPLITGRVYNDDNMPPYELPGNKTQSGIKSRSSKGGTPQNFNEIRFEDKKDSEEVYVHAEKDYNSHVENDQSTTVEHDQFNTIGNDRTKDVGNDETNTIGNDQSSSIGNNQTITIGNDQTTSIGKNQDVSVGTDLSISIGNNESINIGKNLSESVGGESTLAVTESYSVQAKKIMMVAEDEIIFKTGNAQIVMKKNGDITLKGKNISVQGSGDVVLKGTKVISN